MKLTDEQEAAMNRYSYTCAQCGREIRKGYCGRCDEFYNIGHEPNCPSISERDKHDHAIR